MLYLSHQPLILNLSHDNYFFNIYAAYLLDVPNIKNIYTHFLSFSHVTDKGTPHTKKKKEIRNSLFSMCPMLKSL